MLLKIVSFALVLPRLLCVDLSHVNGRSLMKNSSLNNMKNENYLLKEVSGNSAKWSLPNASILRDKGNAFEAVETSEFTKPLDAETNVNSGEEIILKVEFKEHSVRNIKWTKDGKVLSASTEKIKFDVTNTSSSMSIKEANFLDRGEYSCTIEGKGKSPKTQTTVSVKAVKSPEFTKLLEPEAEVNSGEEIILKVEFKEHSVENIKWTKDGNVLAGSTEKIKIDITNTGSSISIKEANFLDNGEYSCTINGKGQFLKTQTAVSVKVVETTEITKSLEPVTFVRIGENIILEVAFKEHSVENVKWTKDDKALTVVSGKILIDTTSSSSSVTIENATFLDSGVYSCRTEGNHEVQMTKTTVSMRAVEHIKITKELNPKTSVNSGENIILQAEFEVHGVEEIEWTKDNYAIAEVPGKILIDTTSTTSSIMIEKATFVDSGDYSCWIRGNHKFKRTLTTVSVKAVESLNVTKALDPKLSVNSGNNIILHLEFKEHSVERIKWTKDDKVLARIFEKVEIDTTSTTSSVTIQKATFLDSGIYSCSIEGNHEVETTQTTVSVKAVMDPEFTLKLNPETRVNLGEVITLTVTYMEGSVEVIKWKKDGKDLEKKFLKIGLRTGIAASELTILNASLLDGGRYSCSIEGRGKTQVSETAVLVKENGCEGYSCENDGVCKIDEVRKTKKCLCREGYIGKRCQIEVVCSPNPCLNEGKCSVDCRKKLYMCRCTGEFTGRNCEIPMVCKSSPCQNGGTCFYDKETRDYACICKDGYIGRDCEIEVLCSPNPCMNGGRCLLDCDSGNYSCDCINDYSGTHCEKSLDR